MKFPKNQTLLINLRLIFPDGWGIKWIGVNSEQNQGNQGLDRPRLRLIVEVIEDLSTLDCKNWWTMAQETNKRRRCLKPWSTKDYSTKHYDDEVSITVVINYLISDVPKICYCFIDINTLWNIDLNFLQNAEPWLAEVKSSMNVLLILFWKLIIYWSYYNRASISFIAMISENFKCMIRFSSTWTCFCYNYKGILWLVHCGNSSNLNL